MVMVEARIPPFREQDLIAHAGFLRGLAGSLVGDPATADDAVQEAYVAALRRRPGADRSLRPWLARVVVNAVRKMRRGAGRRAAREQVAARPEALPDMDALRGRERLLRVLLDAVLALPDADREAVLLRHYEALAPRAIAARWGVPVEQVYARLERALARLRARLDAAHQGERRAWMLGLSGALGLPPSLPAPVTSAAAGVSAGKGAAAGATGSSLIPAFTGALVMSSATATMAAVVVSLGVGLGAGWFVGQKNAGSEASPAERPAQRSAGAPLDGSSSSASAPRLEGQDPAVKIGLLEKERAALQTDLAAAQQKTKVLEAKIEALTPKPIDPKALRFGLPASTPGFDAADWSALATHVVALAKAMPAIKNDLVVGKFSPASMDALQKHNMPLVELAMSLFKELKGKTPNDAYTHPAAIANLIRAALMTTGEPLTPAQEQGIVTLGKAWSTEMERLTSSRSADAPELAGIVAEVAAKERFLRGLKDLLTPTQRTLLWQPEIEDRVGLDIFSPGLVYQLREDATEFDAALMPAKAVKELLALAGLGDVDAATFTYIGQQWVDESPAVAREPMAPRDPEVIFPTLATVQTGAQAQLRAMQRILETGKLTPEQAAKLRQVGTLIQIQLLKTP